MWGGSFRVWRVYRRRALANAADIPRMQGNLFGSLCNSRPRRMSSMPENPSTAAAPSETHANLWLADIVLAFRHLQDDGVVWLQNVYDWIRRNRKGLPRNFADVIRATIYRHSTDSKAYVPGNPDVFRKVAHGGWVLRLPKEDVPGKSTDLRVFVITHMSVEELQRFAGKGNEFIGEIDRRAEVIRDKFGMS
jgi:hypothetical protein